MQLTKKNKIIAACVIIAGIITYSTSYLVSRHHRLSYEFLGSRMIFDSSEQASEWQSRFREHQSESSLDYKDSSSLYVLFWPAIQIDSALTGRSVDSPNEALSYSIPKKK
jgi:hypothetical protein